MYCTVTDGNVEEVAGSSTKSHAGTVVYQNTLRSHLKMALGTYN